MAPNSKCLSRKGDAARAWRSRGDMILRIIASIPLGYAFASLWAMALARVLPGDPAEATVAATLIAFVLCALAVMWAFAARSGWRAFWTLAAGSGVAAALTGLSIMASGRL